jgi:CheY-like chemotaxis protein
MFRRVLERAGWRVEEAENGRAALERIENSPPSLILLDLTMPEIDGFEMIARLGERPELRDIPVVVVTAKDVSDAERARLGTGVAGVFHKGAYERDELLARIRQLVNQARRERADQRGPKPA